jgi:hypothetical protein
MPRLIASLLVAFLAARGRGGEDSRAPDLPAVAKMYGIEIVTKAPRFPVKMSTGEIDGAEAAEIDLETYSGIFAFEWSLYPPELVKKSGLKKVVFCKHLSFGGQRRTAVPDFEHHVLYLDVTRGRTDERYVRKVIHHEFFHVVDLRDDGKLYEDERWARLNPPGFKYGPGGVMLQNDPKVTDSSPDAPGFLNRYAAGGIEEDKAEVFAHLVVEPRMMADRAAKDKYLRAKAERMKELLAQFSPKVNAEFWKRVEAAGRPADPVKSGR